MNETLNHLLNLKDAAEFIISELNPDIEKAVKEADKEKSYAKYAFSQYLQGRKDMAEQFLVYINIMLK